METYETVLKASEAMGEKSDCAVKAIAIVTNHPYEYVHALFKKHGRKYQDGTWPHTTDAVIEEIGVILTLADIPGKSLKTRKFPKKGRYLVTTHKHVIAVVNGKIEDWTAGRQHRPIQILEIKW